MNFFFGDNGEILKIIGLCCRNDIQDGDERRVARLPAKKRKAKVRVAYDDGRSSRSITEQMSAIKIASNITDEQFSLWPVM